MISHDLLRSMVTNQIALDQRDLPSLLDQNARWTVVARRWFPNLVCRSETLDTITFTLLHYPPVHDCAMKIGVHHLDLQESEFPVLLENYVIVTS